VRYEKALTVTSDGVRHVNIVDLQLSYVEPVFFTSLPGVRKFLATPVVVDFFHALELGVPLMKLLHRHLNLQIIAASLTLETVHYVLAALVKSLPCFLAILTNVYRLLELIEL
jgi:hypothetical protein